MLLSLSITHLRNLESIQLDFDPCFNFIVGANASGKTSLLEAIYLLGTGRSFRALKTRDFVHHKNHSAVILGGISKAYGHVITQAAIQKNISGENKIVLNSKIQNNIAPLAKLLPVQIIGPDLELFSDAGSAARRQFLDWGLFYEGESYWPLWKQSRQILCQRNALLKQSQLDLRQLDYWDDQWAEISNKISQLRCDYLSRLIQSASFKQASFLAADCFSVEYQQGWPHKKSLIDCLVDSRERDRLKGHTQYGIHRDDIKIAVKNRVASDVLSRGQKKLMTLQLRFAQAGILSAQNEQLRSIFLLDDLASELDPENQTKVIEALAELNYQAFITSTQEQAHWARVVVEKGSSFKMFHVEQGEIVGETTDRPLLA